MENETPTSLTEGIRDTRLIARAIRQRWPIPEKYREAIITRQVKIAIDPNVSPREATAAFKSLLDAEAQNQADEQIGVPRQVDHFHQHELGVVTLENADDYKKQLAARIARLGNDT